MCEIKIRFTLPFLHQDSKTANRCRFCSSWGDKGSAALMTCFSRQSGCTRLRLDTFRVSPSPNGNRCKATRKSQKQKNCSKSVLLLHSAGACVFYGGYAIINRQIVSVCGVKSYFFDVAVKVYINCKVVKGNIYEKKNVTCCSCVGLCLNLRVRACCLRQRQQR